MTDVLPTPPLPDIARAVGGSVAEVTSWFIDFYNSRGAPFNYRSSARGVRIAYKGIHNLSLLRAAALAEKTTVGRISNTDVIDLAAPLAFGRKTQVFDLSPRRFHFGRERNSAYRIPFSFVENGIVFVYFIQPRKSAGLNFDQLSMVGTIVKRYLLDTEFYGLQCDVEFVDLGVPAGKTTRQIQRYNLKDLALWSEKKLEDRLTLLSEGLDAAAKSGRVVRKPRLWSRAEPEMTLFD